MRIFHIGGIQIRPLQARETIELFEILAEDKGLGPGLHFHRNMEESFYVLAGKILFTLGESSVVVQEGESLSVERNLIHSWKTAEKNTKMLIFFTPAQNQTDYFAKLEKLQNRGISWEEALLLLSKTSDNTLVENLSQESYAI